MRVFKNDYPTVYMYYDCVGKHFSEIWLAHINLTVSLQIFFLLTEASLQRKLLDPSTKTAPLSEQFVLEFAEVVGERWLSLASLLGFSFADTERLKRTVAGAHKEQALQMLREWRRREGKEGTYGKLRDNLETVPLMET